MNGAIRGPENRRVVKVLDVKVEEEDANEAAAAIQVTVHQVEPADRDLHRSLPARLQLHVASVSMLFDQRNELHPESQCEREVEAHHSNDVIHLQVRFFKLIFKIAFSMTFLISSSFTSCRKEAVISDSFIETQEAHFTASRAS
jgi:hypothetical protein